MIRWGTLVLVLAFVATACSTADPPPTLAPGTTAVTTSSVSGTTSASTPPPTVTTVNSSAPPTSQAPPQVPLPQTEGEEDFAVIWRELIDYHNWAFQNPELADLDIYLMPECECYANADAVLQEYLANGWHEASDGLIVHEVDVDISNDTVGLLTVIDEHSALVVVDREGNVVRERERRPKSYWVGRVRLTDSGWRIAEWFLRGEIGDAE